MDIKIFIAAHKQYWLPNDSVYIPLQVGREGKQDLGYACDNTGDNISSKNANYCELTGIYWFWKNCRAEYVGLCHYRRYFAQRPISSNLASKQAAIFKQVDYERLLHVCSCLLPVKRNYFIETVRSQYEHAHNKRDLDELEKVVAELYPDYSSAFSKVMQQRRLHLYNMFVMRWDLFNAYCQFLFDVLFALEKRIDLTGYSAQEARVFGYLGERLLNVWLEKNQIAYKEIPVVFLENINWLKKGSNFLKRKFIGR